ncbi:hypothetical protein AQUCO_01500042v1 [Aquilegia coerulea]|uniref:acetylglutamate kinase n=1 Tax=Aquilegia coerulea TaxID=218851 RepID=A0A2G5DRV1_AQUCA|nr:hypothetical protein AQUCO_01500042v1 [Aquilegia coerulea]
MTMMMSKFITNKTSPFPISLSFSKPFQNPNKLNSKNFSFSNLKFRNPCDSVLLRPTPLSTTTTTTPVVSQTRVEILSESLPYIQKFHCCHLSTMKSEALQDSVIKDLVLLSCVGLRPVFVHGGGPEINSWLARLGTQPNFLNGLRVTDASTMEIVEMVLVGKVNKHLVSLINNAGATAVGLSEKDGCRLTARPSAKSAQLRFVGDIACVDTSIVRPLLENNYIPVIISVAADDNGQAYNINADTVAGELAAALGAEKLILLTDIAGILEDRNDPGSLVKQIDIKGVKRMVEEGKVAGGMIPKVNCCVREPNVS